MPGAGPVGRARTPASGLSGEGDRARARRAQAHDDAQGRGLAHAVAAHQADDLAGGDFQGDAAEDAGAADVRFHRLELEEGAHFPLLPRPR